MSALRRNVVTNFAGTGWLVLLQLLVVPAYVGLLGVERFALIGVYLTLQATLRVFDLGLTPTVNRALARYSVHPGQSMEARDFARTFEALYGLLGLMAGVVVWVAAPIIVRHWLDPGSLDETTIVGAVRLMATLVGLQWPISFYQGGLYGLERQPVLNAVKGGMSTLLAIAGVTVLSVGEPSITRFFWSQILVTAVQVALMRTLFWRSLPSGLREPRFDVGLLRRSYRFTTGVSAVAACSVVLTQADKIVLSKMLPLEEFGYYSLVSIFAGGFSLVQAPTFNAIFPRFSALVASGRSEDARELFRQASQLIAVATLPSAIVIALFASEVLDLWTGDAQVARSAGPLLAVLIVGHALNGLMSLPYALQLAHGWTRLALGLNVVLVAVQVPALLLAVRPLGALGAALVWVGINAAYVLVGIPAMHRRLFGSLGARWLFDCGSAAATALAVAIGWRLLAPTAASAPVVVGVIAGALATTTAAAGLVSPSVRRIVRSEVAGRIWPTTTASRS